MDYFKPSLIVFALLASAPTQAFYVSAATPAGWVTAGGGGSAASTVAGWVKTSEVIAAARTSSGGAASAAAWLKTSEGIAAARLSSAVNVGSRSVALPALARLAPAAGRVLATAAFSTPAGFVVGTIGFAVLNHYMAKGFYVDPATLGWVKDKAVKVPCPGCTEWAVPQTVPVWKPTELEACKAYLPTLNSQFPVDVSVTPEGKCDFAIHDWYTFHQEMSLAGRTGGEREELIKTPVTEEEFIEEMAPVPVPPEVLNDWPYELPPMPVEKPELNPLPWPSPSPTPPATLPVTSPTPLRVPQGNPVESVPVTNPKTYTTPVVDINPANTQANPWQVDVVTKTVTSPTADPLPETAPVPKPGTNPDGSTVEDPAKPSEKTPGLCDLYPDILACAKPELDTPKEDKLKEEKKNVSIDPDGGWGGNGSCPGPRHLDGANIDFEFTMVCDFMSGIRPVVIAFAWLAAAMILIGVRSSGGGD